MFESSLMESGGQIKTKSKYWMIGTFVFNAAILATMILIPLLYPEALPKTATGKIQRFRLRDDHRR